MRDGCIDGFHWGTFRLSKFYSIKYPLFWLSLAKIPNSILNMIRQIIFNFLWIGNKLKEGVHLVNWSRISLSKEVGGSSIRNFFWFAKTLAMKILWHRLVDCLQKEHNHHTYSSNIWRSLLVVAPQLCTWMTWQVGNGSLVKIEENPITRGVDNYKLSFDRISHLRNYGFEHLENFKCIEYHFTRCLYCYNATELVLIGNHVVECEEFIIGLDHSGIKMLDSEDQLVWRWYTTFREINVSLASESISYSTHHPEDKWWY